MSEDLFGALAPIEEELDVFDFDSGKRELENYIVSLDPNPTPSEVTEKIAMIQGYRDRVSQMYCVALAIEGMAKREYTKLFDEYAVSLIGSKLNMNEKEYKARGSCRPQYNLYQRAKEYTEIVKTVLNNLCDAQESLSRQITVMQMQIELGEISRGSSYKKDGSWT